MRQTRRVRARAGAAKGQDTGRGGGGAEEDENDARDAHSVRPARREEDGPAPLQEEPDGQNADVDQWRRKPHAGSLRSRGHGSRLLVVVAPDVLEEIVADRDPHTRALGKPEPLGIRDLVPQP